MEGKKESSLVLEGRVTESLPNAMFRVSLDIGGEILAQLSGKMRVRYIRVLPGDRVRVEVSTYDPRRGRIIYRLDKKA